MNELKLVVAAEDDPDDRLVLKEAFKKNDCHAPRFFEDGEKLMNYLFQKGEFENRQRPDLILLDLNMPKKDGREALEEIKANPGLRHIPVVILTTSENKEDIQRCYDLGANSFIVKPSDFKSIVDIIGALKNYWFGIVELPTSKESGNQ